MVGQVIKSSIIFIFILISFLLILLLPREPVYTFYPLSMRIDVDYPFSLEVYKEKIDAFITHFKEEKGFGDTYSGVPVYEEVGILFTRSMKIILPAFLISILFGTASGILLFYYRDRLVGKIATFFSWLFSSIPDFFLFIGLQYLLILLIQNGLPKFSLYGHEHWYSFIIPLLSMILFPFIHMMKFTASALERETGQEYLRTLYAKGLGRKKAVIHMLWNCWGTILNQGQFIMLYILSSLPIIEKLSGYRGAGIQLLNCILDSERVLAFALMLPFLLLMFLTVLFSQFIKRSLIPVEVGEN